MKPGDKVKCLNNLGCENGPRAGDIVNITCTNDDGSLIGFVCTSLNSSVYSSETRYGTKATWLATNFTLVDDAFKFKRKFKAKAYTIDINYVTPLKIYEIYKNFEVDFQFLNDLKKIQSFSKDQFHTYFEWVSSKYIQYTKLCENSSRMLKIGKTYEVIQEKLNSRTKGGIDYQVNSDNGNRVWWNEPGDEFTVVKNSKKKKKKKSANAFECLICEEELYPEPICDCYISINFKKKKIVKKSLCFMLDNGDFTDSNGDMTSECQHCCSSEGIESDGLYCVHCESHESSWS